MKAPWIWNVTIAIMCSIAVLSCQQHRDSISQAHIDTRHILRRYTQTRDPSEVIQWLTTYHGEAPSHQVMITFVHWGISYQAEFLRVLASLPDNERDLIAWAVVDSSQDQAFTRAFGGTQDTNLVSILKHVAKYEQAIQDTTKQK